MCFDSIKIFIYIDEVILIIIMADEKLVPKLRFSGFEDTWVKEKLGNLVEIKSGKSPTNLINPNGKYPYFKVEQLNNCNKYLIKTPYFINDDSLLIKQGSLIFPKRGMAIMANKIRLLANDSFMDTNLMTLTTKSDINNEFLFYFLTNEELSKLADTTSVPQLNNKHINPYPIYIPTIKEQEKIANFLSIVDKKIELLIKKHQSFLDFKKYLMQQIFAQKLRFISNIDGYFTVKLNKKLKISKGRQFEVIINNPKKSFAICNQSLLSNSKKLPENVSMASNDGINWAVPKDYVFCIKAFTTSVSNNLKARPNLTVDALTKYYHGPEQLIPKLTNSNAKNIQININNRTYHRSVNNNGITTLNIDLPSGKYNASVKYVDSNFDIAVNALVTVKPTIIGKDITKYFKNDTQYNVIVYDNSGNLLRNTLVKFNINGKFYNRTTNDNGIATLNINLPPHDYIITAKNLVSTEECSNKVKVLSIIESEDLSMHYLDGSTFDAKLLDGHGNPYPDQTITFNVNGIKYYRTTDNDGIARLNIRLSQGSYIITSSFNGCNKSNNIIVT